MIIKIIIIIIILYIINNFINSVKNSIKNNAIIQLINKLINSLTNFFNNTIHDNIKSYFNNTIHDNIKSYFNNTIHDNIKSYFNNTIHDNINLNIGNVLSAYFYDLGYSIISKKDFTHEPYNQIFFKDFPTFIPFSQSINIYNILIKKPDIKNIFNGYKEALWEVYSKEIEYFWLSMKPYIQSIYNKAFAKNNLVKKVNNIVIHFRCGDTPFCRHSVYHFQKYKFFKDALEYININIKNTSKKDYNITILYNNTHLSNEKNMIACDIYANELLQYIQNLGYNVELKSTSNIDDFAELYYAPAVISTSSSFSFMSGFFGNGIFISPGHFDENTMIRCNNCDEWLYKDYDLLHKDVVDYYDTKTVINQLNLSANNNNAPVIDIFLNTA